MKIAIALLLSSVPVVAWADRPVLHPHEPVMVGPENIAHASEIPRLLWLNRCAGDCVVHKSATNNARDHFSSIPDPGGPAMGDYTISAWNYGDPAWNDLVKCVKEVYSPYAITVTDVKPTNGESYNEAIVAGTPNEIARSGIGGIAPGGCEPYNNVISFTFSGVYGGDIFEICATVAQESGHAYGMDHEYEFLDGRSACTDPMTYREDCGGQQFFRGDPARCGEYTARDCLCGNPTQNSHLTLLSRLGAGTPITKAPTVSYVSPAAGTVLADNKTPIIVTAGAQRGVRAVELWINGYKWNEVTGVEFGGNGQPAASYQLKIPDQVPNSVLDIEVVARDDINVQTKSAVVRITKGAACATEETCLNGQRCDEGRCMWDPAVGELGDPCTFEQYCKSGICGGTATEKYCTTGCVPGSRDSCEVGYDCLETGPGNAICFPHEDDPGCCNTTNGLAIQTGALGFGLVMLLRRRRRR